MIRIVCTVLTDNRIPGTIGKLDKPRENEKYWNNVGAGDPKWYNIIMSKKGYVTVLTADINYQNDSISRWYWCSIDHSHHYSKWFVDQQYHDFGKFLSETGDGVKVVMMMNSCEVDIILPIHHTVAYHLSRLAKVSAVSEIKIIGYEEQFFPCLI